MPQNDIPEGMSRIEKSQILGGLQALYDDAVFRPIAATTVTGSDGGNAIGWMPGESFCPSEIEPKPEPGLLHFKSETDLLREHLVRQHEKMIAPLSGIWPHLFEMSAERL